jgi:hypothetical protein
MRWIVSIAAAAALMGTFAVAVPTADAKKAPTKKQCMATTNTGKKVSFTCAAAEKCCWQPLIQKGACVPAPGICL